MATLESVETKLDLLVDLVKAHLADDKAAFDHLEEMLNGNGQPGLKTRLDRLEQTEEGRRWNLRTIWAALVAIIVGWAFKWTTSN